jgi:hypothetical protein
MNLLFIRFHFEYHNRSVQIVAITGTVLYYRYTEIYPELSTGGVVPVTRKSTFIHLILTQTAENQLNSAT